MIEAGGLIGLRVSIEVDRDVDPDRAPERQSVQGVILAVYLANSVGLAAVVARRDTGAILVELVTALRLDPATLKLGEAAPMRPVLDPSMGDDQSREVL